MAIEVPEWAQTIFLIGTGETWPHLNEDDLWSLAAAWADTAIDLNELIGQVNQAAIGAKLALQGDAGEAFSQAILSFTENNPRLIPALAEGAEGLAKYADKTALDVQYAKWIILAQLVPLVYSIYQLIAASYETFGASLAGIPPLIELGQWIAKSVILKLIQAIVFSVVMQMGFDIAVQAAQFAAGTRKSWDWDKTKSSAITGVVGGIFGQILHGAAGKMFGHKFAESFVSHVVLGAVHEYGTEVFSNAVQGEGFKGSPFSLTAGGTEGLLDWGKHRISHSRQASHVNINLPHVDIPSLSTPSLEALSGFKFDQFSDAVRQEMTQINFNLADPAMLDKIARMDPATVTPETFAGLPRADAPPPYTRDSADGTVAPPPYTDADGKNGAAPPTTGVGQNDPVQNGQTAPGQTGVPGPGQTGVPGPGQTGVPGPGQTGVPGPGRTEVPGQADAPGQADVPGRTEVPGQADVPGRTEAPGQADVPGQTEAPGQADVPGQAEAPGQRQIPDQNGVPGSNGVTPTVPGESPAATPTDGATLPQITPATPGQTADGLPSTSDLGATGPAPVNGDGPQVGAGPDGNGTTGAANQPGLSQPGPGQPGVNQPGLGQPGLGQPGVSEPGLGQLSESGPNGQPNGNGSIGGVLNPIGTDPSTGPVQPGQDSPPTSQPSTPGQSTPDGRGGPVPMAPVLFGQQGGARFSSPATARPATGPAPRPAAQPATRSATRPAAGPNVAQPAATEEPANTPTPTVPAEVAEIPAGWWLPTGTDSAAVEAAVWDLVVPAGNWKVIAATAEGEGVRFGGRVLNPAEFADLVRSQPGWDGHSLVLVAGRTGNRFAAAVRAELGVDVIAPQADAVFDTDKRVKSGDLVQVGGTGRFRESGEWVLHPAEGEARLLGSDLVSAMQRERASANRATDVTLPANLVAPSRSGPDRPSLPGQRQTGSRAEQQSVPQQATSDGPALPGTTSIGPVSTANGAPLPNIPTTASTSSTASPAPSSAATSSDVTSSDVTSSDGTSSDGTSSDGTSSDATSSDGTSSDGTSSDGNSSDGTSSAPVGPGSYRRALGGRTGPGPAGPLAGGRGFFFGSPADNADAVSAAAAALPTFPAGYVVAAHATADGQRVLVDGQELTPAQFAGRVRNLPGYQAGQPVLLVACGTALPGPAGRSFADGLAAALDTAVLAPDAAAWQTTDGRVLATATGVRPDGTVVPIRTGRDSGTGHWVLHTPTTGSTPTGTPGPGTVTRTVLPADLASAQRSAEMPAGLRAEPAGRPVPLPSDFRWVSVLNPQQQLQIQQAGAAPPNAVTTAVRQFAVRAVWARGEVAAAQHIHNQIEAAANAIDTAGTTAHQQVMGLGAQAVNQPTVPGAVQALARLAELDAIQQAATDVFQDAQRAGQNAAAQVRQAGTGVDDVADTVGRVEQARRLVTAANAAAGPAAAARQQVLRLAQRLSQAQAAAPSDLAMAAQVTQLSAEYDQIRTALASVANRQIIAGAEQDLAEARALVARADAAAPAANQRRTAAEQAALDEIGRQAAMTEAERGIVEANAQAARTPQFDLPPGFVTALRPGVDAQPSWGVRGRIDAVNGTPLGEAAGDQALVDLIDAEFAKAVPGTDLPAALLPAIKAAVLARFSGLPGTADQPGLGSQQAGQQLASDGITVRVTVGDRTFQATVRLDLSNTAGAAFVRPEDVERGRVPVGEKQGTGADQLKEDVIGSGRGVSVNRSAGITPQGPLGFPGLDKLAAFSFNPGGGVSGGSGANWSGSELSVVSAMRQLMYDGRSAYFNVPGAVFSLSIREVHPVTGLPRGAAHNPAGTQLPVRLGFPTETAEPAGQAAPVPGNPIGLTGEDELRAAGTFPPDGSPAAAQRAQQIGRIEGVLGRVFAIPQSIAGLEVLRERLLDQFPNRSQEFSDNVYRELNEAWLLQEWGPFFGAGRPSSWLTVGGGTNQQMGFDVRAGLRSIQRVDTGTTRPGQLKIESRVGKQVTSGEGGSGSVSARGTQRFTFTFGDTAAPPGGNSNFQFQLAEGVSDSSGRSASATLGGGEWRTVNYGGAAGTAGGPTVLYRAEMRYTARLFATDPNIATEVGADGVVFIRVPEREAARFEAEMAHAVDPVNNPVPPPNDPAPALPAGAPPPPAHRPPTEVEHDSGLGPSVIDRLGGSERVLPGILDAISAAERNQSWALRRSPREQHRLLQQLAPIYGTEGMVSSGEELVSRTGLTHTVRRQVSGGTETIKIKVRPRRAGIAQNGTGIANPPRVSQVDNASIDLIPTFFSEAGANESLTVQGSAELTLQGAGGLQQSSFMRKYAPKWLALGGNNELSGSKPRGTGQSTGVFSFGVRGALFDSGPVQTFDYDVSYDIEVEVDFKAGVASRSWTGFPQLAGLMRAGYRRLDTGDPAWPTSRGQRSVAGGLVRYVVPEALAPLAGAPAPALPVTPNGAARGVPGSVETREAGNAFTGNELGARGDISQDDMITGVLGAEALAQQLRVQLAAQGMRLAAIEGQIQKLTTPAALRAHLLRNPDGQLTFEVTEGGFFKTKRARITLQASTFRERPGTATAQVRRLDILESQPKVEGAETRGGGWRNNFRPEPGTLLASAGNGAVEQLVPYVGSSSGRNWSESSKEAHTGVSGRWLTHEPVAYNDVDADVVWTATTMVWGQNLVWSGRPNVEQSFTWVDRGLQFLRPAPVPAAPLPAGVPPTLDPGQLPGETVNDRLEFLPVAGVAPNPALPEQSIVTPRDNPAVEAVQRLLRQHGPGLLTSRWTIEGVDPRGAAPQTLQAMLNSGALNGHIDLMLGAGLVLRPAGRAFPFWNSRPSIVLRATRDPDETATGGAAPAGYTYDRTLANFSQGVYWTGYYKHEARRGTDPQLGGGLNLGARFVQSPPGEPAGQHTPGGNRVPAVLEIPGVNVDWSATEESARSHTTIDRDTYRMVGPTDRYANDRFRLEITYVPASRPSKLLNTIFGGIPAAVWSRYSGARQPGAALTPADQGLTERLFMRERVLVPRVTQYTDVLPGAFANNLATAPAAPVVQEVAPEADPATQIANAGLTEFEVTPENVLHREVHVASIDHRAIRDLASQALRSFAGEQASVGEQSRGFGGTVARLLRLDGGGFAGFLNTISFPRLTRASRHALGPDGYVSPPLVREGGVLTDTNGRIKIRYRFYDGRPLDWVPSYLYSETYHFDESETVDKAARSAGGGLFGGPIIRAGERDPAPGSRAEDRNLNLFVSGGLSAGNDIAEFADSKRLRGTFRNRETEYLRVRAGIMVEIEIDAHDQRAITRMPQWAQNLPGVGRLARFIDGGTTRLMFRIDDAAELLVDPETARARGIQHQLGHPVPAGRHFPADAETTATADARRDRLVQAYALPSLLAPTPYPGGTPTPAHPGGSTGLYTLTIGGLDPVARTVTYRGQQYTAAQFAALVRRLPDWAQRPLVLAAGGAAQPHPDGAGHTSFAQELSTALGVDVLATPDDVYQDAHGRVRAARFALDAGGRPVPGGFRPGNWVLHRPAGPPTVHGEDLVEVARTELPVAERIEPRPALPAVFAPAEEVGWTGSTVPLDELAGRLTGTVDIGNGLTATRLGGNTGPVVIGRAGVAPPATVPGPAPAQGSTTVTVIDPAVRADALLLGLQRLQPLLPPGQRNLQLLLPGGAATGAANSFAQHAAGRLLVDVTAHAGANPQTGGWFRFRRNAVPVPVANPAIAGLVPPGPPGPPPTGPTGPQFGAQQGAQLGFQQGPPPGLPPSGPSQSGPSGTSGNQQAPGPLGAGRGWFFGSGTGDPALVAAARAALPQFPGAYVAAAHTSADGQRVVLGDGRELTPEQFVAELATTDYVPGTPLVLVACQAGATPAGGTAFAAEVGHVLPTPADVWAADTDVWQTTDGRVIATPAVFAGGQLRPQFGPGQHGTGNWLRFPAATAAAAPAPVGPAPGGPGPMLPAVVGPPTPHGADLVAALAPTTMPSRQPGQLPADFRWAVLTPAQRAQIQQAGQQPPAEVAAAVAQLANQVGRARAAVAGAEVLRVVVDPARPAAVAAATAAGTALRTVAQQAGPAPAFGQLAAVPTQAVEDAVADLAAAAALNLELGPARAAATNARQQVLNQDPLAGRSDPAVLAALTAAADAAAAQILAAAHQAALVSAPVQAARQQATQLAAEIRNLDASLTNGTAPDPAAAQTLLDAHRETYAELQRTLLAAPAVDASARGAAEMARATTLAAAVAGAVAPAEATYQATLAAERDEIVRQAAITEAERRIVEELLAQAAAPQYVPPRGFADQLWPGGPALHPSWGVRGRIDAVGGRPLGGAGDQALIDALAPLLEDTTVGMDSPGFVRNVQAAVRARLSGEPGVADQPGLGSQQAGQQLASDGITVLVTEDGRTYRVNVSLTLGPADGATVVPADVAERGRVPVGEKQGTGADQLKEDVIGSSRAVSVSRPAGITPQGPLGFPGFGAASGFTFNLGGAVNAGSGANWTGSELSVVSAMRQLMYDGRSAYFDVPGSRLWVTVQEINPTTGQPRGHLNRPTPVDLAVRVGFPTETAAPLGAPPALGPRLGLVGEGQARHEGTYPVSRMARNARREQERRVEGVLGRVFAIPQSIAGLERLRERVLAQFPNRSQEFADNVYRELNEAWLLQEWGVFAGPGRTSSWLTVGGGTAHQAGFSVRTRLRSVQRVENLTGQLKIESRIGKQVTSTEGGSGSVDARATQRFTFAFGDPAAAPGQNHNFQVQLAEGGGSAAARSASATTGGGEWRTVNYTGAPGTAGGPTVLYRAEMRYTAELFSTDPNVATEVGTDGVVYIRVPEREVARFEAELARAMDPAAAPPPPTDVDPVPPANAPVPPAKVPPAEVEHDVGLGPAVVDRLGGSERVLPEIITAIREAERNQPWALPWSPRERLRLRQQLAPIFGTEGMVASGQELVSRGGLTHTLRRSVAGGTELIKIKVRPRRAGIAADGTGAANPSRPGRVDNASIDVIPTFYSEVGANDTITAKFTPELTVQGARGLQANSFMRRHAPKWLTMGANYEGSYTWSRALGQNTGVFSFGVRGALFDAGPVRTFDYDVSYDIDVEVEFRSGTASRSWAGWQQLRGLARAVWRRSDFGQVWRWGGTARRSVADGLIRYVVPDGLAPAATAAAPGTAMPDGAARPPAPGTVLARPAPFTTTQLAQQGTITQDDMVTDVLGSDAVADWLRTQLVAQGMRAEAIEGQIQKLTTPAALRAHLLRNADGQLTFEVTQGGLFTTKRARITLQAATFGERQGTGAAQVRRLDILESQPKTESSDTASTARSGNLRPEPGTLLASHGDGSNAQAVPYAGRTQKSTWADASKEAHTGVSGRWLTHGAATYDNFDADVVWTATTMVWGENLVWRGGRNVTKNFLWVDRGLQFLRPAALAAAPLPAGVPAVLRPGQLPGETVNDRLEFITPPVQYGPPTATQLEPSIVTPKANPAVAAVQRLLRTNNPALLTRKWTVEGTERRGAAPETLQAMLNSGALNGHIDMMLGAGLVLRPASRAFPFWISRPSIVLRATRDPSGYHYDRTLEGFSQGVYWTGYDKREARHTDTTAAGANIAARLVQSTPTEPAGQHTPGGNRVPTVLEIPGANVDWSTAEESARSHTTIDRDTYRMIGSTDRYVSNGFRLDITYVPASRPSRLLNAVFGGAPAAIWSWVGGLRRPAAALTPAAEGLTEQLLMRERVLVPRVTQY
ncbi:MAG TPA: hypothetical protein VMU51_15910, partial [Mycobacteriales bacterium]|nr:hypothetical protein [Mycobacteriales bacterium]